MSVMGSRSSWQKMVPALDDFPHDLSQESSTRSTRGWNFFYTGEQGEPVDNSEMATSVLFSGSIKQECCQKYSCHFENTVCIFLVFPWGLSNLFLTEKRGGLTRALSSAQLAALMKLTGM